MYLSRLRLNRGRVAAAWLANPYRVHQRLKIACDGDARLLFRIEESSEGAYILVQSHLEPDWAKAFADLSVLLDRPEYKLFDSHLQPGRSYRFRLLANPAAVKTTEKDGEKKKQRMGLLHEADQRAWLARKLSEAGTELVHCVVSPRGLQHSHKAAHKDNRPQTHLVVLFDGALRALDPARLEAAIENGIGPAKGYGLGLLSLAALGPAGADAVT